MDIKYDVQISPRACAEFEDQVSWLKERSMQGAKNWSASFSKAVEGLQAMPERFGLAPESEDHEVDIR